MKFHLPTIEFSAIDLANRVAAATGGMRYAQNAASADYNGHFVCITFNTFRRYWVAEYTWSSRNVIARGSLRDILQLARRYYDQGAKSATVSVAYPTGRYWADGDRWPDESRMQFAAICKAYGFQYGSVRIYNMGANCQPHAWWTPKHDAVADAFRAERYWPGIVGVACNLPDDATDADWQSAKNAFCSQHR